MCAAHFGSSVLDDHSRDVDLLVITRTPKAASAYSYRRELEAIRARMCGDYAFGEVSDPYGCSDPSQLVEVLSEHCHASIELAIGPGRPGAHVASHWALHVNGPMTTKFWRLFAHEFPIHAWVIRNNARCLVGTPPPVGRISADSLGRYVAIMSARLGSDDNSRVPKKLMQAYGLLSGCWSCLLTDCVEASFPQGGLMREIAGRRLRTSNDRRRYSEGLLMMLKAQADLMAAFDVGFVPSADASRL